MIQVVSPPRPPAAERIALEELAQEWNRLRHEFGEPLSEKGKEALEQFLRRCLAAGRWFARPDDRHQLQALAAAVAELIYWGGGGAYPQALIQPADECPADERLPPVKTEINPLFLAAVLPEKRRLIGRWKELQQLDEAWNDRRTHVLSIEAMGGAGKTALLAFWLTALAQRKYRMEAGPIESVFAWSFFNSGASSLQSGVDLFFSAALKFFGDTPAEAGPVQDADPSRKGTRLAQLAQTRRALLILDGLEPFQHAESKANRIQEGAISNPALAALVSNLAASNAGLLLVTTRLPLADLAAWSPPTTVRLRLGNLNTKDGVEVLKSYDLKGTDKDFRRAAAAVQGHCLSLVILGSYLRDAHAGDVTRWREVDLLGASPGQAGDDEALAERAWKLIRSYERWFQAPQSGDALVAKKGVLSPEIALLRIMGLFDHPIQFGAVLSLLEEPKIHGLNDPLSNPEDLAVLPQTLHRLTDTGLLSGSFPSGSPVPADRTFSVHPLVQEYFSRRLQEDEPAAWRAGHARLFDYYRAAAPQPPQLARNLEEITPLFYALTHGCKAGRYKEAFDEVLKPLIHQDAQKPFSWYQLGAFDTELAALHHFFKRPWVEVVGSLGKDEAAKVYLQNAAAYCLRALGRLKDAIKPLETTHKASERLKLWVQAASAAGSLSEQALLRGILGEALQWAESALDYARRSGNLEQIRTKLARLGDVLHQQGQWEAAVAKFQEAEAIQAEIEPGQPKLYSFSGFFYCNLLLSQGAALAAGFSDRDAIAWEAGNAGVDLGDEPTASTAVALAIGRFKAVRARVQQVQRVRKDEPSALDLGLGELTLGLAELLTAFYGKSKKWDPAESHLKAAEKLLRQANQMQELPRALLAAAFLKRLQGKSEEALLYLDEALIIATRSDMRRYLADIYLEFGWVFLAKKDFKQARDCYSSAKGLIIDMGYRRRNAEVEALSRALAAV